MAEIVGNANDEVVETTGGVIIATGGGAGATRKEWFYLAVALVGGMIGGALTSRLMGVSPAVAAPTPIVTSAIPARSDSPAKSIAAEEIVLVDAKGKRHAELLLNGDGLPVFRMYDNGGKNRLGVGFGKDGFVGFDLADQKGTERLLLSVNGDGLTALRLFDDAARPRLLLGIDSQGEPAIDFYGDDGKLMRELP